MARIRNLATCDFVFIRGWTRDDIQGARFLFNNRRFELRIEAHIRCRPNWEVTIGPLDLRKKNPMTEKIRFLIPPTDWTQEALTTALFVEHAAKLKLMGIEYALETQHIELPEGLLL